MRSAPSEASTRTAWLRAAIRRKQRPRFPGTLKPEGVAFSFATALGKRLTTRRHVQSTTGGFWLESMAMSDVTRILGQIERGGPHRRRAATAARLRRTAQTGRRKMAPGKTGPDVAGHGPGARGVYSAGGRGEGTAMGFTWPLLFGAAEAMDVFWWRLPGERDARNTVVTGCDWISSSTVRPPRKRLTVCL